MYIFSEVTNIHLPLDMDTKRLQNQLDTTKVAFEEIATTPNHRINNALIPVTLSLPLPLLLVLPLSPSLGKITFGFTNILGPTKKASFVKNEILDIMFTFKTSPDWNPVEFCVLSYNGNVKILVSAHSRVVRSQEEADEITNNVYSELNQMIHSTSA